MENAPSLTDWMGADVTVRARWRTESRLRAAATGAEHGVFVTMIDEAPHPPGVLEGVPFAIKDNIDVLGVPTTAGSTALAPLPARADAGVVSVLRRSGAVPIGKTNMHELAFGLTSNNAHYGPIRNPLDPATSAGGSSGGSAAAVALGVVPFSLATDTGGSVTVPAAFCGVVGFRPSTGRYPGDGIVNLSWTRDTVGVHAGSVHDVRIVDSLITHAPLTQADEGIGGMRIGVLIDRLSDADPSVQESVLDAARQLERAGGVLVDVTIDVDSHLADIAGMTVVRYEVAQVLPSRVQRHRRDGIAQSIAEIARRVASADVRAILDGIAEFPVSDAEYAEAREGVWNLRRAYAEAVAKSGADILAGPACIAVAPPLGDDLTLTHVGERRPLFATLTRNTGPGTLAGVPMLSLPAGRASDGAAVGLMLEGAVFDDVDVLRRAEAIERVLARGL